MCAPEQNDALYAKITSVPYDAVPYDAVPEDAVKLKPHQKSADRATAGGQACAHPRIGIMGGTFDPIHNGHLVAASEVAWALKLDEVIFVPTGNPSFKQDKNVTAAEHRYLMTVIATSQNPQFSVSRVDIDRPGVTYTIDTLRDLRKEFPDAELFFITGADAIAQMATWKDAEKLFSMAKFVAVGRPGYKLDLGGMPEESVIKVEIPALAISSTDCRHRASIGEPLWYLVPDGVVRYIDKYGLYRDENEGALPDLPSARLPHSTESSTGYSGGGKDKETGHE